ncbi:MAG: F0F1 ATP synthase subunit beta, partial [SAR324 cluster bacterium]|nr:F0F1 ATP synthase subunit beta [SAR324 cluster bacterium]
MSNVGKVVQVMGPVVDIAFAQGSMPEILNAINIESSVDGKRERLVCEV